MTGDAHDHDREDQGEPAEPEPEQPEPEPAHDRPDTADMRAALLVTRAILNGADHDAHQAAAEGGSCPACTAMAGISFMITVVSELAGDKTFVSEPVRLTMLTAVDTAEQELGSASN